MQRAMNGEGSFRRISKEGEPEKWTGRKQFGFKSNGKPNIKAVYGKSERECRRKMREYESSRPQTIMECPKTTFIDYLNNWFEVFKKPKVKRRTYNTLQDVIKNRIAPYDIAHYQLSELSDVLLQQYITGLATNPRLEKGVTKPPYSRDSVKKTYNLINGCLKYAEHNHHIVSNPLYNVVVPSEENMITKTKTVEFFEKEDIIKIYNEATRKFKNGKYVYSNNGLEIALLMFTGLRIGEALGLTWADYNATDKTLTINKACTVERDDDGNYSNNISTPKTLASYRTIPLSHTAVKLLEALYSNSKPTSDQLPIFVTKTGNRANPRNLRRTLNSIQETVDTKIQNCGLHVLRHTFVSFLLNETPTPVKVVSELVGHASPDITLKIYAHTLKKQKEQAANAFDQAFYTQLPVAM